MSPWLLAILFVLALAALIRLVRGVLRMLRDARLCDVPLEPHQQVEFATAGRVILCIEGPRFTPGFRRLSFALRQPGGAEISGRRLLFRTIASGRAHARMTLKIFDLPMAGRYELSIGGLEPRYIDAPGHTVVFMRPHLAHTIVLVIGITLASALAISSLVFFLLSVLPTADAIDPGRATGYVQIHGARIELREACAELREPRSGDPPQAADLRIVLSDREVPQESLSGQDPLPVLELARRQTVRGLLLRLDPGNPGTLTLALLASPSSDPDALVTHRFSDTGNEVVRRLQLSHQRVGGDLTCPPAAGFQCTVHFSAPVFHE